VRLKLGRNNRNRRTRGGPGRHNAGTLVLQSPEAKVRICLRCDEPFWSRDSGNRFCGECAKKNEDVFEPSRKLVLLKHRIVREEEVLSGLYGS